MKLVTNKHTGRKVLINKLRDSRENDFLGNEEGNSCPFCPGENEEKANFTIDENGEWQVKAIDNKYPALVTNIEEYQKNNCDYGKHEVLIETREHLRNFYDFNNHEFENIIKMYKNRYIELDRDENVEYTIIYKNHLKSAGASKIHSHSQILSMSFIPPEIKREVNTLKTDSLWGDKRIITENESFELFLPEDSYLSGEMIIENKNSGRFNEINEKEIKDLAKSFKEVFRKIKEVYGTIPFNIYLHSLPKTIKSPKFRWHIHVIPRKGKFGGFELGTGLYINSLDLDEMYNKFCKK
ncbi:MAG: DUF4931 domain-containing protein [Bacillota bacterium]|nr:DUF4931 domain-containing protein [Bacillota bacterium]